MSQFGPLVAFSDGLSRLSDWVYSADERVVRAALLLGHGAGHAYHIPPAISRSRYARPSEYSVRPFFRCLIAEYYPHRPAPDAVGGKSDGMPRHQHDLYRKVPERLALMNMIMFPNRTLELYLELKKGQLYRHQGVTCMEARSQAPPLSRFTAPPSQQEIGLCLSETARADHSLRPWKLVYSFTSYMHELDCAKLKSVTVAAFY